jgi:signal peptidase I
MSGLVLKRDIYYTQNPGYIDYVGTMHSRIPRTPVELFDLLAEPRQVAELGPLGWTDYTLGEDRFLMLGDNSPRSKDSRGWRNDDIEWDTTGRQKHEVPRSMLTGKAFCIYWPHGVPLWPDFRFNADFRFPFRPYVERMGLIH